MLEEQTKEHEQDIKNLDEQIDEQIKKEKKIKEGLDVSKTESLVSSDFENNEKFKETLFKLGFSFEEKKKQKKKKK